MPPVIYIMKNQKAHFVENIKNDLVAITVLKVGQIANWRKDRLAEARGHSGQPDHAEANGRIS